jgi:hypothetical protein
MRYSPKQLVFSTVGTGSTEAPYAKGAFAADKPPLLRANQPAARGNSRYVLHTVSHLLWGIVHNSTMHLKLLLLGLYDPFNKSDAKNTAILEPPSRRGDDPADIKPVAITKSKCHSDGLRSWSPSTDCTL